MFMEKPRKRLEKSYRSGRTIAARLDGARRDFATHGRPAGQPRMYTGTVCGSGIGLVGALPDPAVQGDAPKGDGGRVGIAIAGTGRRGWRIFPALTAHQFA